MHAREPLNAATIREELRLLGFPSGAAREAAAREQLGEARGDLTAAQAAARTAQQQADAAEPRAAELLTLLRRRSDPS
ncbi:hypothetical protein [Nonomuraea candida]|uniref:hypothetical protein n=1 Tax=Nonomuraea candida TaxID=359159 RepID=UPI0005BC9B05|nr:hypothetical protein [Nonomuraea candida]